MTIKVKRNSYNNFEIEIDTGLTVEKIDRETINDVIILMYEARVVKRIRESTISEIRTLLKKGNKK